MKLLLTLLASYIALTNAAPVTITETVIVSTKYITALVNGSPTFSASELVSTQTGASASFSADTTIAETFTPATATPTTSSTTTPATTSTSTSSKATTPITTSSTSTSSSSTSTSTGTATLNSFESAILNEHNVKRALHGANPLTWDSTLAEYAANYAANSFSCDNVQLIHSGGPYGENLAAGYVGGAEPVDAWYDEIKYYDYNNPVFSESAGHFTQVVWASTTKVGCAKVTCDNIWQQYTICEYSPAGNVIGYFSENVYPLKG